MTSGMPDNDDALTLRFVGQEEDGTSIHELRAAHVAEVLMGVAGLAGDFAKAGAFGDGPGGSEVLVRPPREGSFEIDVIRMVTDNPGVVTAVGAAVGAPTLTQVLRWATRSARADVKDFTHQENGLVKVTWQDDTVDEVPLPAWVELNKHKRRRKKHLRQIMTPLSDERVSALEVNPEPEDAPASVEPDQPTPESFTLTRPDYNAVKPEDEVEEDFETFEIEAQMSAINFDDRTKWKVKIGKEKARNAAVEDEAFLRRVAAGLALSQDDIFSLRLRRDTVVKNGRTTTRLAVLEVLNHRRATRDDDPN